MASRYVEEEVQIVAMCKALDDCLDLDIQLLRVCRYLEHGITVVNWNMDDEAVRRQHIRREMKETAK